MKMNRSRTEVKVTSSFRDPNGFLFVRDGLIYRQVNASYQENYDLLMSSGLFAELVDARLLISHEEVTERAAEPRCAYKVIRPERIPFISYPYEWSFSQLKDAALTTLEIQKRALDRGMSLKDCSAYNIQFHQGRAVLIDTRSLERHREGQPWVAYRQYCQHFLAPLALMSYRDIRLSQLLRVSIDGIPLDLASSLLPFRTRFKFGLLSHIHLHATSQKRFAEQAVDVSKRKMSRLSFKGLVDSLESTVRALRWRPQGAGWADYYETIEYSPEAFGQKQQLVAAFLDEANPQIVWDLGANTGLFSRIVSARGALTISFDSDPACVEKNYLDCVQEDEANILPLVLDLTNPSPALGWQSEERMSLLERGPADMALALALIHHLAISNNVPLGRIAEFFHEICHSLIIEFVPKTDPKVQKLLSSREDIFAEYTQEAFQQEFGKHFTVQRSAPIEASDRILYLMSRRDRHR
jgi:ribosomal protein L11 methylase PrmA